MARTHYENFAVASLWLPRRLVPHFHAVYAFCRWADDLADETPGHEAPRLLNWWREELLAMDASEPRHPVMVALRETVRRFSIPLDPFLALLTAFEQDQRVKRYESFPQLLGYCAHSANPVGHLVLYLFESFSPERAALADEICTGLQLANFWQDVAPDFDRGRVYLPVEDRTQFGYSDADLAARRFNSAFADLLRFEVTRTRGYFDRGAELLLSLPRPVRPDVALFLAGGRAVLDAIERVSFDVWSRRPVVTRRQQLALLARAAASRLV